MRLPQYVNDLLGQYELSARETELCQGLLGGVSTVKGLAKSLKISENTVSNHLQSIFTKMDVTSKSEIVAKFVTFLHKSMVSSCGSINPPRVLHVDDEPEIGEIYREYFEWAGIPYTFINCPLKALSLIRNQYFDFIITDMAMPELDGHQFAQAVKKICPYAPKVLVLSGNNSYSETVLRRAGVLESFEKPINLDLLLQKVTAHHSGSPYEHARAGKGLRLARVPASLEIKLNPQTAVQVANLSLGGLRLESPHEMPDFEIGKKIQFAFALPPFEHHTMFNSELVWKKSTHDGVHKFGLKFLNLNYPRLAMLANFVNGVRQKECQNELLPKG